ncbi:hypothetical protein FBU30_003726 [Linnemannia zychae]|nr:hypothetical protein FBU30_003726 [Linnemannia zychae]
MDDESEFGFGYDEEGLKRLRINTVYIEAWHSLMGDVLLQEQFRKNITQLELPNPLPEPAYAVQFMESYRGLTGLMIRLTAGYSKMISTMIQYSGSTLENIRLLESTSSAQQNSVSIDSILEGCCRLKTLRVDVSANTPGTGIAMDKLLRSKEWSCKDSLEEMSFRINNPKGDSMDPWSCEIGILSVVRLFEKLKTLPRLRHVDFSWGDRWDTVPLGLAAKRIKVASGGKMSIDDIKWMGLHWK